MPQLITAGTSFCLFFGARGFALTLGVAPEKCELEAEVEGLAEGGAPKEVLLSGADRNLPEVPVHVACAVGNVEVED